MAEPLSSLTELEATTYAEQHYATYTAQKALLTAFTDSTERSPTFRLYPLDPINQPERKSWIQIWTPVPNQQAAWLALLQRPFRGLNPAFYQPSFEKDIPDKNL